MSKRLLSLSAVVFALVCCSMGTRCFAEEASEQLEQAEAYISDSNYTAAEAIYKAIVQDRPGTDEAFTAQQKLIILYIDWGKETEADAAFQELVTNFSGNEKLPGVLQGIGGRYREIREYQKACDIYKYVVEHWAESEEALYCQSGVVKSYALEVDDANAEAALAELFARFSGHEKMRSVVHDLAFEYRSMRKWAESRDLFRYFLEHWPDDEGAMKAQRLIAKASIRLGDDPNADAAIEKLIKLFKDEPGIVREMSEVADDWKESSRYEKAMPLYKYVLDTWPESEEAMDSQEEVVKLYIKLGDDANAEAAFDKLLAEFSGRDEIEVAVYNVAEEYQEAGEYEKALQFYKYVVDSWPESEEAMESQVSVTELSIELGREEETAAAVDKLVADFSDNDNNVAEAFDRRADAYRESKKYDLARKLYQCVVDNWPSAEHAVNSLSGVVRTSLLLKDDANAAEAKLIADYNDNPNLAKGLFQIAEEQVLAKNYQKALKNYQKVLTLWEVIESNYPDMEFKTKIEIPFMLARCHYHLRDYPTAMEYFKRTVEEVPGTKYAGWSSFYLAAGYRREGNYEKALEYYQKVVAGWPDLSREWSAHHMIGVCYEHLTAQGVIGKEEGHALIRAAYEQVIAEDPNSDAAKGARGWLRFNVKPEEELEGKDNE